MPGRTHILVCPKCSAEHEIDTGADQCCDACGVTVERYWNFEQYECKSCETVKSIAVGGCDHMPVPTTCPDCGSGITPWKGGVWFEAPTESESDGRERVAGPCPACGEHLDLDRDGGQIIALWD